MLEDDIKKSSSTESNLSDHSGVFVSLDQATVSDRYLPTHRGTVGTERYTVITVLCNFCRTSILSYGTGTLLRYRNSDPHKPYNLLGYNYPDPLILL